MCACGDLHPAFVCSRHRDTPDDPHWWVEGDETPQEQREHQERERLGRLLLDVKA
jgi:hypothetical protein